MPIDATGAAAYLKEYVASYRREYERFVASPPVGAGFPRYRISPYLYSGELQCHLARDGAAIADTSLEPPYDWAFAGGPALMVDYSTTRVPSEVVDRLKKNGLLGKDIGLYRIVAQEEMPDEVWHGSLPQPHDSAVITVNQATHVRVAAYKLDWSELVKRLTFGAIGRILKVKLPTPDSDFWNPLIIRNLGFLTADRSHKRFFHYLELLPHVDAAAWEPRSIRARVHVDIQRDFAHAAVPQLRGGGAMAFAKTEPYLPLFVDRLSALQRAIDDFQGLLDLHGEEDEKVFHEFLRANPILLDVYGEARSKPRFYYPKGESPLGKAYIEPDFVIQYPGNAYKLVELEKPSKKLATRKGQPTAETTQAAFQIAEWKTYIQKHYELIKNELPGISVNCTSMIVISRRSQRTSGTAKIQQYMELVRNQFSAEEILLYDDLLARARQAYIRLSSAAIG